MLKAGRDFLFGKILPFWCVEELMENSRKLGLKLGSRNRKLFHARKQIYLAAAQMWVRLNLFVGWWGHRRDQKLHSNALQNCMSSLYAHEGHKMIQKERAKNTWTYNCIMKCFTLKPLCHHGWDSGRRWYLIHSCLSPFTVVQVAAVAGVASQFQLACFVEGAARHLQCERRAWITCNNRKTQKCM